MKKILIALFTVIFFSQLAIAQTRYQTYSNARFGYHIQYPVGVLKPQTEAENGDGRIFSSSDGNTEMRVWGQYNALSKSLRESYDDALNEYGSGVTYKVLKTNGYVISGTADGRIFYQKTLIKGKGDNATYYTFSIKYPRSDKAKFDPIVTRIAVSFNFD